ncbi:MAG: helix-turn-helix transcriptional regulator, partial [Lachnospiraceae bacterium]|nr:helix-turn-helix transcriptional regulator [Lachnospiraceae bacterium]
YTTLKERTSATHYLILENLGEQVNSIFQDAIHLGSHLQLNKYVIALSKNKNTMNSSPIMDRYYLQKDLFSLHIANGLIEDINIYFPANGYIVNSTSCYDISLLPYIEPKSNTMSKSDWDTITDHLASNQLLCYSAVNKDYITIAKTLSSDSAGNPTGVLCIQINKEGLLNQLQSKLFLEYSCCFALIDTDSLLMSTKNEDIPLSSLSISDISNYFASTAGSSAYEVNSENKLIINSFPLLIPNTALISITEKSDYQMQMTRLLEIMGLTILFCVLLGIAIIMYFSQKNYEPVSQILSFIKQSDNEIEPVKNEYHLILQTLTQNHNEIEHQKELLRNNYLQKIFSGEITLQEIPNTMDTQFCFHRSFDSVCMVVLSADAENTFNETENTLDLTTFIVKNVLDELLSEQFPDHYFCIQKQKISVLISVSEQSSDSNSASDSATSTSLIESLTQQLITFLSESFQLSLRAGISCIQKQDQISNAYFQANNALEYEKLFNTKRVCRYETIPQIQLIGSIPLNTSEYVSNLVIQNNASGIKEYFQSLKDKLEVLDLSWNDAKSCFYFFYQVTAKLQLYYQSHYNLHIDGLDFLDKSFFMQPLPQALSQTCEAYLNVCTEFAKKQPALTTDSWVSNICQFIDKNYFNANINLNTIAEHFQISPSYLSKKFKQQYEKSIIDYLYEIRIAKSLSLLEDLNLKVADIAQKTGFVDSNAYIRIFKKLKGITPGKYRENQQEMP